MKKIVFIILAAALVLALGIGIYYKAKVAKLPIEKVLPKGAVFYVRISDIENRLDKFKSSRLWRNISGIDVEMLLQESGLSKEEIEQYRMFRSEFSSSMAGLFLNKYFGQEVALALYPAGKISSFDSDTLLNMASNLVLVTRLKPKAEFIQFVSKLSPKFGRKSETKVEKYKGGEITTVKLNDKLDVAYVKIKDLLVIGLGKRAAMSSLDVIAGDTTSLFRDKDYLSTMSKFPRAAETIAYGNLGLFYSNLRQFLEVIPETKETAVKQKAEILESFDKKVAGFKTTGFASLGGEIREKKLILVFDKNELEPMYARVFSFKPQKNNSIDFVPEDIIYYQWANTFDAKLNWDNFQQELSKQSAQSLPGLTPAGITAKIENALGISIEDTLIPALGNEMGGFLADINLEGFFPIPEILFFVQINDKSTIRRVIGSLVEKNNIPLRSEEYKGNDIKYISLPFGKSLQPGYSFLGDYLLISTRSKLLKESIDTLAGEAASLQENNYFKAVDFGLSEKNNAVFFLKSDRLLGKLKGTSEWGVEWASVIAANLKSRQQKAEQYLDDLKADIRAEKQELKQLKADLPSLKEDIKSLRLQGLDASLRQQELVETETKIRDKEEKISLTRKELEKKEQALKNMAQNSPAGKMNLSLIELYLNEAVYPVLEGLQTIKAVGSRSIIGENTLETQSFSITEE